MSLIRAIFAFENGREVANLGFVFTECLHSAFALGSLCLRFRRRRKTQGNAAAETRHKQEVFDIFAYRISSRPGGWLFDWVKTTKVHPLISSCVFHYEFEFIHPFADGNGRLGGMWQTLLLMRWKPIFAWIPVETIVKEHQQDYYAAIAQSDSTANSTPFITFMLRYLKEALDEMNKSNQKSNQIIVAAMRQNPSVTINELQDITGLSESGVKKIIRQLRTDGIIQRIGGAKGGHWQVILMSRKP